MAQKFERTCAVDTYASYAAKSKLPIELNILDTNISETNNKKRIKLKVSRIA